MKIKWYGHACFRIEGEDIVIVIDPYTPEVAGLDSMEEPADVVVISFATDRFRSDASMVPGDPKILNALEIAGRATHRPARPRVAAPHPCGVAAASASTRASSSGRESIGWSVGSSTTRSALLANSLCASGGVARSSAHTT
jgi:hypothetical protein